MSEVKTEGQKVLGERLSSFRAAPLPHFEVGDAVQLTYTTEVSEARSVAIRGTVIAKRNKGVDSSFTILNYADDDTYVARYPLSSPLLKELKVLQKWRVTEGKRRPRRAKLYYLQVWCGFLPPLPLSSLRLPTG